MPDISQFGQLGALVLIVLAFLKYISARDVASTKQTEDFTAVIKNHLGHAQEINERLIDSNNRLEGAINRLVDKQP